MTIRSYIPPMMKLRKGLLPNLHQGLVEAIKGIASSTQANSSAFIASVCILMLKKIPRADFTSFRHALNINLFGKTSYLRLQSPWMGLQLKIFGMNSTV